MLLRQLEIPAGPYADTDWLYPASISPSPELETWALSLRSPEGSTCTVRLGPAELAVTADFGHPDAAPLENTP